MYRVWRNGRDSTRTRREGVLTAQSFPIRFCALYSVIGRKTISDATLILVLDTSDRGTDYTEAQAQAYGRPLCTVQLSRSESDALRDKRAEDRSAEAFEEKLAIAAGWLETQDVEVLNVAGPRESNAPGLYAAARVFLERLFERLAE